ncbi:TetR/AcrR family transcriptional regulator [Nonomuraea aridisoli]|uniref:TetR/AcrR family transcriptional regulator n=1 Tax=Nonomuraea aridisoli TaxID=2070368 RepID=UPI001F233226|nr:TetR/AcrR family transcriptional regulator [Nonomuraea aridisoli]
MAAIDLFTEQGYDSTTVNGIAERAGLTKTTFFRHFPDKREVLFAGQEARSRLLFTDDLRAFAPRLLALIADNVELRERAVYERSVLAEAMTDALRKRGVPDVTASLAAELGVRAFHAAYARWADPAEQRTLTDLARDELRELRAATTALG